MVGTGKYRCVDCGEDKPWEEMTNKKRQLQPNLMCNTCIERRKVKATQTPTPSETAVDKVIGSMKIGGE